MKISSSLWIKHAEASKHKMWWKFLGINKCASCIYKFPLNHDPKHYCRMFTIFSKEIVKNCPCY